MSVGSFVLLGITGTGAVGLAWLSRRWSVKPRRVWPYVWIVTVIVAVAYSSYALWLHAHYETHGHDLGIYDQAVWHLSRFEAPITTIRRGPVMNLFGDHFDPILSLLVPFAWIFRSSIVLLVAQALLFSAMVPLFFLLGIQYRLPPWPALTLAASFALNPGIFLAVNFDFHDLAFAPLLFIGATLAAAASRWRWYWTAVSGLLLTKEPLSLYAALLGLMIIFQSLPFRPESRPRLRHGLGTVGVCLAGFFLITRLIIPSLSNGQGFLYWRQYQDLGATPVQLTVNILMHPARMFGALVDQPEKRQTMKYLLASAAFIPALNWTTWPLLLLAFGERFWSSYSGLWPLQFHYQILIVTVMGVATFGVLRYAEPRRYFRGASAAAAVVVVVISVWVYAKIQPWQSLVSPNVNARPINQWNQVVRALPADDSVSAQDAFVPHLAQRQKIYQFPNVGDAQWIILDPRAPSWPLTPEEVRQWQVTLRQDSRWTLAGSVQELTVFRRQ